MNLAARVEAQAARTPDSIAVRFPGGELTFTEFKRRTDRLAATLVAHGVRAGDLVPICMDRCPGLIIGVVGILKAGAAYVPLDPDHPRSRLENVLADTGARHVIASARFAQLVADGAREIIVVREDGDGDDGIDPAAWDPAPIGPDALAYVIYTSGSTGRPKGVMNEHGPVLNRLDWMIDAMGIGPRDRILQKTTLSFDVSVWELFVPLICGARLVLAGPGEQLDPKALVRTIRSEGVTLAHFVPSMLGHFLDEPSVSSCSSLRAIVASGEALLPTHVRSVQERLGCRVWNLYGPTEAAVDVTYHVCDPERDLDTVPIGRPVRGARIYVVDDAGSRCPVGVEGELWIGGVPVARGYLGRDELTRERFRPDPFLQDPGARVYRTGDRARLRADGDIEYLGRLDDQVKIRGVRIELGEVEAALLASGGVRDAAVIARDDAVRGRELVAFVVPRREGPTPTVESLRASLASRLPEAFVPAWYVVLSELPRTSSGKVDRRALATSTELDRTAQTRGVEPETDSERSVLAAWRGVLGSPALGMDDDFLMAGGHSLLAIRIAARLELSLGVRLPVRSILAARTARTLARFVAGADKLAVRRSARVAPDAPTPLTRGQRALWIDHRLDPRDTAFHVPVALQLHGGLDAPALVRALRALAHRHEALRTRFVDTQTGPVQVVDASPALDIEVRDARGLATDGLGDFLCTEARRAFDLANGPPFRALVIATSDFDHHLLLTFHHIAVDEWSIGLLLGDLGQLYRAEVSGTPADLQPVSLQMPDAASWICERESVTSPPVAAADDASTASLPSPFGATPEPISARVVRHFPDHVGARLLACSAHVGATPFELALTAFGVLLRRLTGRDHVRVWSPRTVRDGADLGGTVGYLLEMVVAGAQLRGSQTFRAALAAFREGLSDGPEISFSPPGRRPQEVVFVFLQDPAESLGIDGIATSVVPVWTGDAKYPLGFEFVLRRGVATCTVEFRRDQLCETVAEEIAGRYERVLTWLLDHPDNPISDAPIVSEVEHRQLLRGGTGPEPAFAETSIHRRFERVARRYPTRIAAKWKGERLTYGELDSLANRLARRLVADGIAPGDRVPLVLHRTPRRLAAALAVLKAGGAYVPLDPDEPEARRASILDALAAKVVLTERGLSASTCPNSLSRVLLDSPDLEALPDGPLGLDGAPDSAAYVMFTSGTTGHPKGVVVPHRGVLRLVLGQSFAQMNERRTWLHLAPSWFDASTLEIWAPLLHGGTCVVLPSTVPELRELGDAIREHGVDSLWLTSSLFNAVVDHDPALLTGLTQLLIGGEVLSPAHVRRAHDAHPALHIVNGYGPTENTTFTACHTITDVDLALGGPIPIGRPIAHTRSYVVDIDGGLAPPGVPGELCVAGQGLAIEYLGHPDATEERFVADPWATNAGARMYRTGDLARWRPDGALDFVGRLDRQIKLRGFRIEPAEVEAALARHPAVQAAVVDVVESELGVPVLVAWYVVFPGTSLQPNDLRTHLASLLPRPMLPTEFVELKSVPRTKTGKLDRTRLPRPARARGAESVSEADLTPTEQRLHSIWAEVLGTNRIGPDDDFFELGGTSLLAIQMVARVERDFGLKLLVRTVLTAPTLRLLARALHVGPSTDFPAAVVPLRVAPSRAPLFCVPGLGGHVFSYRLLLDHLPSDRPLFGLQVQELAESPELFDTIESLAEELVRQMRAVQKGGPYYLLGYSFGGNLAFEMARQLRANGETGGLLLLIDAYPAGAIQPRTGFAKFRVHVRELSRRRPREMWQYIAERLARRFGRRRIQPDSGGVPELPTHARSVAVERRCRAALGRYVGGTLDGSVTLLRALRLSDWMFLDPADPTCGWGRLVREAVRVHTLDCEHLDVFQPPHISELGRLIHEECIAHDERHGERSRSD